MECDSDSNDDYNYEQEEEEGITSNTDLSDVFDDEIEARCVKEWTYVTDPFSDQCKTPLTEFQGSVEINQAILLSNAKSPVDYFEIFFEKIVSISREWKNKNYDLYFEDIECKTKSYIWTKMASSRCG